MLQKGIIMSTQINFKKGSVEMLLLHVLSCKGDCYGYQLSQLIKKSSENTLDFQSDPYIQPFTK